MILSAATLFAQAPQRMSYQAVVRNSQNQLVTEQSVSVRISILQGSVTGAVVYSETHTAMTNANGLLTIEIGGGTTSDTFDQIEWANGLFFLKSEIDPAGGINYSIESVQQLMSVPYALYATQAGNGFSGDYNDLTNTPQIPQIPANVSAFNNDAGYITMDSVPAIPTNVSVFTNDAGYLTNYTETDPTVPAWAKEANKPAYDYLEIANTPIIPTVPSDVSAFNNDAGYITMDSVPTIPANVSAFTNDAGYLTNYTEIDPTVPAWAKETNKPAYDYSEIANTPTIPTVPTNVSAFNNDAGYITMDSVPTIPTNVSTFANDAGYLTNYTEIDPTVPAWAKETNKPAYDYSEIANTPTIPTVPTNVSAFNNDAGYITMDSVPTIPTNVSTFANDAGYLTNYTETDPTVPAWAKEANKPAYDYSEIANTPTIPTVPTNVSAFTNDAGYITMDSVPTIPANVSAFTNDAGYLTEASCNGVAICEMLNTLAELQTQVDSLQQSSVNPGTHGLPIVTTSVVSDIATMSATCGGEVTSDSGSVVIAKGVCWNTVGAPTISDNHTVDGGGMGGFLSDLQALTPGTIYFVRAYATNSAGTAYGEEVTFATTFTCGYNLIDGNNNYTTHQYGSQCWMTQNLQNVTDVLHPCPSGWHLPNNDEWNALGTQLQSSPVGFGNGHYVCAMPWHDGDGNQYTLFADFCVQSNNVSPTGSACEAHDYASGNCITNYYPLSVRCVRDENGVGGTTQVPAVTTATVSDIAATSVTCGGEVTSDSGSVVIAKGVCWNTTGAPTISDNHTIDGGGTGFFVSNLQALTAGTTYFVRAYATNSVGTAYGQEITFTTVNEVAVTQGLPIVTTSTVSDIVATSATCGGEVISDGGSVVIAKGVCWNTTGAPTISGNHTISGGGTGSFLSDLQALTPSTTYFVRAYATNNAGTAYGEEVTFTTANEVTVTQGLPTVTTAAVSYIVATSATCGGEVISDGGSVVMVKGVCWNTIGNPTISGNHTISGGGTGSFLSDLQALTPSTTYYVRAYATNDVGTAYGEEIAFTTANEVTVTQVLPTVTTAAVSDIAVTNAICGGEVTSDGGSVVSEKGVCWNTTGTPTISDNHTIDGGGTGLFLSNLQALTPSTTYSVRAYATNDAGTAYGEEITFTTVEEVTVVQGLPPTVMTAAVTNIATTSATCGGEVTSDGGSVVIAKGVCWNTTGSPTISDNHTIDGGGTGFFLSDLQALTPSTTYFVRAYATNDAGTAYGEEVTFTTANEVTVTQGLPSVTTAAVTDIATTSATCGGEVTSDSGSVVIAKGVCWNTTGYPTISDNHTVDGGGTGPFLSDLQALTPGAYFVRAYATNSAGTAYGEEVTFMMAFTCGDNLIDGSNSYPTKQYNRQCWMTENLRKADGSENFNLLDVACPTGWHLPTRAEWNTLSNYVSNNSSQDNNIPLFFENASGQYWIDSTNSYEEPSFGTITFAYACEISGNTISPLSTFYMLYAGMNSDVHVRCVKDEDDEPSLPTVTTAAVPGGMATTTFTCGGEVTTDGGSVVVAKGVCWNTTGSPTISDNHTINGGGMGSFFSDLTALSPNTLYFVRAYATNSVGTAYGDEVQFWTENEDAVAQGLPTVTTATASDIETTSATCGGMVISNGESWVSAKGLCWNTTGSPTISDNHTYDGYGMGTFMRGLTALNPNTLYFVRAYATNGVGTAYGDVVVFRTANEVDPQGLPSVTTAAVSNLAATSATCGGEVTSDSGSVVVAKGVCWNTTGNPTLSDNHTIDGGGVGSFSSNLQALDPNMVYFVRAYATNSLGTAYGEEVALATTFTCGENLNYGNNTYTTHQYDSQCWMTQNLRKANGSENFNWGDAICPAGWHLPTNVEWLAFSNYVNNNSSQDNNIPLFFDNASGLFWMELGLGLGFTCEISGYTISLSLDPFSAFLMDEGESSNVHVRCVKDEEEVEEPSLPTVTTAPVPNNATTTITCGGEVTSDGGYVVVAKGVCWNTTGNPTISDNHTIDGGGVGPFIRDLQALRPGTTYYLRAYATNSEGTNYGREVSFTIREYQAWDSTGRNPNDALPCQDAATVTDHEGNIYNTVQIGNQCWMRENMRCTTSPSTGTTILEYPASSCSYTGKKAYYVDGSAENTATYGLLYNWCAAVDTFNTAYGETSTNTDGNLSVDVTFSNQRRGICPAGWHVPSDDEWRQLLSYVYSQNAYTCVLDSDSVIAKALASTVWDPQQESGICAVGQDPSTNNTTGFSVVPSGVYNSQGYSGAFSSAHIWASTQTSRRTAYDRWINTYEHTFNRCGTNAKCVGFTVRCLRDE